MKKETIKSEEYSKPITIRALSRRACQRLIKSGKPDGSYKAATEFMKAVLTEGVVRPNFSEDELDRFVTLDHHNFARMLANRIIAMTKGK